MAKLNVNPTRMELRRLKTRLKTAVRGHKLLKDKSDEMIRRFMAFIRENKRLREEVHGELAESLRLFALARGGMTPQEAEQAVSMPARRAEIYAKTASVMGLTVPKIEVKEGSAAENYPYSFLSTPAELDGSLSGLSNLLIKLLKLAEVEKTCNMLAEEIEKNRRRVNALEYILIPQLQETIKYITMKLDENERGNLIRLMKVKEIIAGKDA